MVPLPAKETRRSGKLRRIGRSLRAAAFLLPMAGLAQDNTRESIPYRETPAVIDGRAEDWLHLPFVPLGANASTEKSQSAAIFRSWSESGLSFLAWVFDDAFVAPPAESFEGDAVDIFLDLRRPPDRGRSFYSEGVHHLRFAPNAASGCSILSLGAGPVLAKEALGQLRVRHTATSNGWMLEAHLPWTALGHRVEDQPDLHLAFGVVDSDNARFPGTPTLGARPVAAGPNPHSDPGAFDALFLGDKAARPAPLSCSADEVVFNGTAYLEITIADLAPVRREQLMLQVGSRPPIAVDWTPTFGGAFAMFSVLLPAQALMAESAPLEIALTDAAQTRLWTAKHSLALTRQRQWIDAELPEAFLAGLAPERRAVGRYFKEVAEEITELMALGPRDERARLRQLRARSNPDYFAAFIGAFVRWARRLPELPGDHFLLQRYHVWRSPADGSLQLMKLELPVGYQHDRSYPIELNFHPLLRPGERYRFLTELARLDAQAMPDFQGKNIRVTLFGRGNSFDYTGMEEVNEALAWVRRNHPSSAGSPVVFGGISDGATWAFEYATRNPDQVDYIDLRSGGYGSRLVEMGASFAETALLRRLYDPKERLDNIRHVHGRITAGADDTRFLNATVDLARRLEEAGSPIRARILANRGHDFVLPPLDLQSSPKKTGHAATLTNTPLAFAKRKGWEVVSLARFGQAWTATSEADDREWRIRTQNIRQLRITGRPPRREPALRQLRIDDTVFALDAETEALPVEFERRPDGAWQRAASSARVRRKNDLTAGPMAGMLARKFIFVLGTRRPQDEKLIQFRLRRTVEAIYGANPGQLAGARFVVKRDVDMTPDDLSGGNLWLIGNEAQNSIYAQWADELPIRVQPGRLAGGMGDFKRSDLACTFVHPNPANLDALVYVDAGTGSGAFFSPPVPSLSFDYCVTEANGRNNPIVVRGFFDHGWAYAPDLGFRRN